MEKSDEQNIFECKILHGIIPKSTCINRQIHMNTVEKAFEYPSCRYCEEGMKIAYSIGIIIKIRGKKTCSKCKERLYANNLCFNHYMQEWNKKHKEETL